MTRTQAIEAALTVIDDLLDQYRYELGYEGHNGYFHNRASAEIRKELNTELAALALPADPAPGWVLVPEEPTRKMLRAMVQSREGPAVYRNVSNGALEVCEQEARDDYCAALSARPTPQEPTT